uniref:VPS37 C-terminal domain-containing protein n=1 Tax=Onchocerca volvulus TaxID=6282 RepID=A0A8R1TLB3_ONCVO
MLLFRSSSETIVFLLKTQAGDNLLLKFIFHVCVKTIRNGLVQLPTKLEKELIDLKNKISKLNRFCLQTELAMTHLEALVIVADTDADIASVKSDLRKEKAKINNFLKFSNNILDVGHTPSALNQDELRLQDQFNLEKERMEEVALEEFLSCRENED